MAGVPAKHADDVELHYAATNKEWTSKHVKEVGALKLLDACLMCGGKGFMVLSPCSCCVDNTTMGCNDLIMSVAGVK